MKKIGFILLLLIGFVSINAQVKHPLYLEDTINNISGRNIIATKTTRSEIQYLYKTVYVDSAKFRTSFDTLLIEYPGVNKVIVIDNYTVTNIYHVRAYDKIVGFGLYYTKADKFTTPDSVYTRTAFWEISATTTDSTYKDYYWSNHIFAYRQVTLSYVGCGAQTNTISATAFPATQESAAKKINQAIRLNAWDLKCATSPTQPSKGNTRFKVAIKYHIETIN